MPKSTVTRRRRRKPEVPDQVIKPTQDGPPDTKYQLFSTSGPAEVTSYTIESALADLFLRVRHSVNALRVAARPGPERFTLHARNLTPDQPEPHLIISLTIRKDE